MREILSFEQFAARYCERQEQTPERLFLILGNQKHTLHPEGWMLLECEVFDSSRFGSYTILPYGGESTFKDIPDHPISPRGLASDQSVVVAVLLAENLPETLDQS